MATDNKDFKVKNGLVVTEGGTFGGTVSVAAPTSNTHAATKLYVDDLLANVGGGSGSITVSETPPESPEEGDLWYSSADGSTYVYYDSFWVETTSAYAGPTGGPANTTLSSDITLLNNYRYFVDTNAPRTVTLPASPSLGDEIVLIDANNLATTNNVTVNNNGEKIDGIAEGVILDVNAFIVTFLYTGTDYGWRLI